MSHLNREPFHKHQNSPSLLNSGLERKVNGEILTVLKNHVQSICASKYCHQCLSLVVFDTTEFHCTLEYRLRLHAGSWNSE